MSAVDSVGREFLEHPPLKVGESFTIEPGEAITLTADGRCEIAVAGMVSVLEKGQSITYEAGHFPLKIWRSE